MVRAVKELMYWTAKQAEGMYFGFYPKNGLEFTDNSDRVCLGSYDKTFLLISFFEELLSLCVFYGINILF